MAALLDANVLVALVVAEHVHHDVAEEWLSGLDSAFATTPLTQGSLMRFLVREGSTAGEAARVLRGIGQHERHDFWPDDLQFFDVRLAGVVGHRQLTDAYLAELARRRGGRIVTFDRGLAAQHPDVTDLIGGTGA